MWKENLNKKKRSLHYNLKKINSSWKRHEEKVFLVTFLFGKKEDT